MRNIAGFFLVVLILFSNYSFAGQEIVYAHNDTVLDIGKMVSIFEDETAKLDAKQVLKSGKFVDSKQIVPNLNISSSAFWTKINVKNFTSNPLLLELAYPVINEVELYKVLPDGRFSVTKMGEYEPFSTRKIKHQNYLLELNLNKNESATYLLKIKSDEAILLPMKIGSRVAILENNITRDMVAGIYFGIIFVMFLYNLFLYFIVKDKSYLFYVIYILSIGLTLATLQGYAFKYLWPDSPWMAQNSAFLVPSFVGFAAIFFLRVFLKPKQYTPNLDKGLHGLSILYIICIAFGLAGQHSIGQKILQGNAMFASLYGLFISYRIYNEGYKPAKYFLIAWTVFLASVIVFVLRNFDIVPYNNITHYSLQIGSVTEIVLLSFALADRINVLKKEALEFLKENERIIREQNVILEKKVEERTHELTESHTELSRTLQNLKETQSQLISAEKMASLGQLTAGIAHEINNPINFVMSNVSPLKRNIADLFSLISKYDEIKPDEDLAVKLTEIKKLKKEIDSDFLVEETELLLKGIHDGASRTSEIVKGMKNFSRLDEYDIKLADVNEGLDITLTLLKNLITNKIKINKELGQLPFIECNPGKLNQVFMNVINNAIHAVKEKKYPLGEGPIIEIKSSANEKNISISIKDNGVGMSEETQKKIFEPFFTTKDVGVGTGLGLSIVYSIVKSHLGEIFVESKINEGTNFTIILPLKHQ